LTIQPSIKVTDFYKTLIIETDAPSRGLEVALKQEQKPVAKLHYKGPANSIQCQGYRKKGS